MLKINDNEIITTYKDITRYLDNIGIFYTQVPTREDIIEYIRDQYDVPYNDTIKIDSSTPNYPELRKKFNREHIHTDYEMRLFTHGSAKFYFKEQDNVYELTVGPNDLISVPANVKHWFEAGDNPNFAAIRFFTEKDGWEAHYTEK